jgi:DNA-binding XRE family transcriptional regulator
MAENKLENILLEEAISQAQLSKESQLSYTTVNNVFKGRKDVSIQTKYKILKGLNKLADGEYKIEEIFPLLKD